MTLFGPMFAHTEKLSASQKLKILDSIEGKALELPKCFCVTVDSTKYASQMILKYASQMILEYS